MTRIGFATIAESPRDDVVPAMLELLPSSVVAVERGCLDGRTSDQIAALGPNDGEVGIVARLKNGGSTLLSHSKILPIMQQKVDELVNDEGAELIVILCGADWSTVKSEQLIVNPGRVFPGVVSSLAYGRRLGIIKPSGGQIEQERARYAALGIDATVTAASPYAGEERLTLAAAAATQIRDAGCDLVWMTCIGMDVAMRDTVAEITRKPTMLAQALLARVVAELLPQRAAVFA
ncbi:AroM family protein [soil metagenome]